MFAVGPHFGPKKPQDGRRWPQDGPEMAQDGPKLGQDGGVSPVCSNHSCNETLEHGVRNRGHRCGTGCGVDDQGRRLGTCLGVEDRGAVSKPTSDVAGVDELPESSRVRCRGGRYDSPLIMHVIRAETQCLVEQICAYIT